MKLIDFPAGILHQKLQAYLETDKNYKKVFEYTKKIFEEREDLTAHNWAHAYRDTLNAIVVGEAEGADMSIVLPAITMHDIGFLYGATGKTHGAVGADNLKLYLKEGNIKYSNDMIDEISSCIRTHKGSMHQEKPDSLEAKVVADADLIEKFGPIGVYQTIRTFTEFNYPIETLLNRAETMATLTMETKTGEQITSKGVQFILSFVNELNEAYEPYTGADNETL